MAVHITTLDGNALLSELKDAIDKERLTRWSYDSDGDFTQTSERWANEAWLRPDVQNKRLSFHIIAPQDLIITKEVYGVFHARMVEALLNHCDAYFEIASVTAFPEPDDDIGS